MEIEPALDRAIREIDRDEMGAITIDCRPAAGHVPDPGPMIRALADFYRKREILGA